MGNISYDFGGRTVVITGAAQGIGLALATFFDAAGADTILVDLDADTAATAVKGLGRKAHAVPADVSSSVDAHRGRFAAPAEMCAAVGFLASEEAGYVTGIVLPVDGGVSI